jgi:predicted alpha/beta-fold hydrolase
MIINSSFIPAPWLNNGHLQTIWPFLMMREKPSIVLLPERLELPDGDFVDLLWNTENNGALVIVLHGLGGCSQSHYVQGMLARLYNLGYKLVFMHMRSCSEQPNRLVRTFHAADTSELNFLATTIQQRYPDLPIAVLGFSLGGSVLLKWLGENLLPATHKESKRPPGTTFNIRAAVAISVPFVLSRTADRLEYGFSRIYQRYLLSRLKAISTAKHGVTGLPVDLKTLQAIKTLREFDRCITAPINGFSSVEQYYNVASSRQYLHNISTPSLILHALDDPFVPADCIPEEQELSPHITLELARCGGHVGFIQAKGFSAHRYAEDRVPLFLALHV